MRGALLGWMVAWLVLTGCGNSNGNEPDLETRLYALEAQIDTLEVVNDSLRTQGELTDLIFREYAGLINQTLSDMEALTEREGILRQIRLEVESNDGARPANLRTIEERLNDNLAAIENYIRESKRQRDQLKDMAERASEEALQAQQVLPSPDLERLETTVQRLTGLVEQKERTIVALREEANRLLARISSLQEKNAQLVDENTELRQTYYIVDTSEQLEEKGIVERSGGLLGIGRSTRIDALSPAHFMAADFELTEIYLGEGTDRYKVLSNHRSSPHLYSLAQQDGATYLRIHDPEAFWLISRYLVVEEKR